MAVFLFQNEFTHFKDHTSMMQHLMPTVTKHFNNFACKSNGANVFWVHNMRQFWPRDWIVWGTHKAERRGDTFGSSSNDSPTETASNSSQVFSTVWFFLAQWRTIDILHIYTSTLHQFHFRLTLLNDNYTHPLLKIPLIPDLCWDVSYWNILESVNSH